MKEQCLEKCKTHTAGKRMWPNSPAHVEKIGPFLRADRCRQPTAPHGTYAAQYRAQVSGHALLQVGLLCFAHYYDDRYEQMVGC